MPIGCTVITENNNMSVLYAHVSPNFIVSTGDIISQGSIISHVGPKNLYSIPNNQYKDANGNPTNRRHNWLPFTPYNKKRRHSRQSFEFF